MPNLTLYLSTINTPRHPTIHFRPAAILKLTEPEPNGYLSEARVKPKVDFHLLSLLLPLQTDQGPANKYGSFPGHGVRPQRPCWNVARRQNHDHAIAKQGGHSQLLQPVFRLSV